MSVNRGGIFVTNIQFIFTVFLLSVGSFSQKALADEALFVFGGIHATTFKITADDKPVPVFSEGDCSSGPLACKRKLILKDVAPPPLATIAMDDQISEAPFQFNTRSGKTFQASIKIRRVMKPEIETFAITLICTSPNGKSSQASTVIAADLSSLTFFKIDCPQYNSDATHFIQTTLEMSIKKNENFGYLR